MMLGDMPFDELTPIKTVDTCVQCDDPIYEGQEYYSIDSRTYCKECIENSRTFAEW